MHTRRTLLAVAPALALPRLARADDGFEPFLNGLRAEARRAGISPGTIERAFANVHANAKVLELDRHQPEFVLTWEHYRDTRLSDVRVTQGRQAYAANRALVHQVAGTYRVAPAIMMGIWGLETNYGTYQGGFNVIEALATLAWEGRRAPYFRGELMAALRILDHGDVAPERMVGSYAGAMGQPQFMPSSFNRFAVDYDGDGRRDIWNDTADALASMANYLARSGWRDGEGWGVRVRLPGSFDPITAGRDTRRPVADWARMGVTRDNGTQLPWSGGDASVIVPNTAGSDAFLTTANFLVIRKYNPSDFYALAGRHAGRPGHHVTRSRVAPALGGTLALGAALVLGGCADSGGLGSVWARLFHHAPPPPPAPSVHYVVGTGYQMGGVWYYPFENFGFDQTGIAAVKTGPYGPLTTDGEPDDPTAMVAAMQTLQLPSILRVTNLSNGRQVLVRANDRGPANPGRLIALSPRARHPARHGCRRHGAGAGAGGERTEPGPDDRAARQRADHLRQPRWARCNRQRWRRHPARGAAAGAPAAR